MNDTRAHADAFCFIDYKHPETGEVETVYNASTRRAMPTWPERETGDTMVLVPGSRRFAPEHVPSLGDRVMVQMTDATARIESQRMAAGAYDRFGVDRMIELFGTPEAAVADAFKHIMKHSSEPVVANSAVIEQLQAQREAWKEEQPNEPDAGVRSREQLAGATARVRSMLDAMPAASINKILGLAQGMFALLTPAMPKLVASEGREGIYDRNGKAITIHEWAALHMDDDYRQLAHHRFRDASDTKVSTAWLGVDHREGSGPPLIFETMVFRGNTERAVPQLTRRYETEAEARAGHELTVEALRLSLQSPKHAAGD
jgi:hypothetical protein